MDNEKIPTPLRPVSPYISLDDPNTRSYFTKTRIHNHLRRAGLLNKNGEILTQAEYDSIQTDAAIGRENRRKIDDALMEVLNDIAREHWAYARDYTENLRKDLLHQYRRIETQFRRRTQPITIRRSSDGKFRLDSNEARSTDHFDTSDHSSKSSITTLPHTQPGGLFPRLQSSYSLTRRQSNDFDNIRQELNNIRNKLANLEEKFNNDFTSENDDGLQKVEQSINNLEQKLIIIKEQQKTLDRKHEEEKQRIDELYRQSKPHDSVTVSVEIDKQQSEPDDQILTVTQELNNRILMLETSAREPSTGLTQEAIDQVIKISEKKTIERERNIENLIRGLDDKIKKMEIQLVDLLKKFEKLPNSITVADTHQLIQNEIQNFIRNQPKKNEGQDLAKEAINRINIIENQLNQFFQSNENNTSPPVITELVQSPVVREQPVSNINDNFEERLNQLESRINNIRLPSNLDLIEQRLLQLENYPRDSNNPNILVPNNQIKENNEQFNLHEEQLNLLKKHINELDRRKPEWQSIEQTLNKLEQRLRQELEKNYNMLLNLLKSKPDYQIVDELIKKSETQINQQITLLQKSLEENQLAMKNMENHSNDHRRRKNQQPLIATSISTNQSKSQEDSITNKPTSKELQAIMPFIEFLPTFDMFNENEWI